MPETCQHLLFNCSDIKPVREKILNWIGFNHTPAMWDEKLKWIVQNMKGKDQVSSSHVDMIEELASIFKDIKSLSYLSKR